MTGERPSLTHPAPQIDRRGLLLGLGATLALTALPWSVKEAYAATPNATRYWRGGADIQTSQGFRVTVTQRGDGKTTVHVHFSNGRRDGGGVFQVVVTFLDDDGKMIAEVSQSAGLAHRSFSPWARTRTTDRETTLDLAPSDAERIARVRMTGYRYPGHNPRLIYIKFGDDLAPKGPPYAKKPEGVPPYAPAVGFNGVTPTIELSPWNPPRQVPHGPVQRPGLDVPYVDPFGNVVGYF